MPAIDVVRLNQFMVFLLTGHLSRISARPAIAAKLLTKDEARRIAANVAKLSKSFHWRAAKAQPRYPQRIPRGWTTVISPVWMQLKT
jgi:hypothetical protein